MSILSSIWELDLWYDDMLVLCDKDKACQVGCGKSSCHMM